MTRLPGSWDGLGDGEDIAELPVLNVCCKKGGRHCVILRM